MVFGPGSKDHKSMNSILPEGLFSNLADSEIVMVDGTFWDDSFEQDRSWDDFGTTISGI